MTSSGLTRMEQLLVDKYNSVFARQVSSEEGLQDIKDALDEEQRTILAHNHRLKPVDIITYRWVDHYTYFNIGRACVALSEVKDFIKPHVPPCPSK